MTPGDPEPVDLLVVGGGVNGTAIARDAVGRGLSVCLCEQDDLAGHTSSASTKLIHGGLRYLEHYEFRLVREALRERERLLAQAPHIIRPLRFVLPHDRGVRPAWMVRLGLFLYDHLAPRGKLPPTQTVRFATHPLGRVLQPQFHTGFAYSDCWVDDARLVVLIARDAANRGADIRVRTRLVQARREAGLWVATLRDTETRTIRARVLVNAAGPFVIDVLRDAAAVRTTKHVRLVKGSHIVVPRLYDGEEALILQNPDRRIVFAIPYEDRYTLVGTTDVGVENASGGIAITEPETRYLCESVNRAFIAQISPADVVWSYAGVRPLFDDGADKAAAVTRDYVFDLDGTHGEAPVLSIFGGKITTFRKLAEHALARLAPFFPTMGPDWTETALLPGGDLPEADFARFLIDVRRRWPFLPAAMATRMAHAYGTRIADMLGDAATLEALGTPLCADLTPVEIDYLVRSEWARRGEDILWRRSKLGLQADADAAARIDDYLADHGSEIALRA